MKEWIQLQKGMYPDLLELMHKRYHVLYTIFLFHPIGRRGIVEQTGIPERFIRNEMAVLQEQGMIQSSTKGMVVTEEGKHMVEALREFVHELTGLTELEQTLQQKTGIRKVIVVAGDCDEDVTVKQELGRATVAYLREIIQQHVTIAVTGGTTMAAVAEAMQPFSGYECTFVPARGGVGEKVENQANTIVAQMAKAEKGGYRLLHVPDPLSETLYQTMLQEPSIMETLPFIKNAQIVLHGIGEALAMATRRKTAAEVVQKLTEQDAVGEAFGYYFNQDGQIVHKVRTIGIHLDDLAQANVITVAGGISKLEAISAFLKQKKSDVLITDEAVAKQLILKEKI